MLGQSRTDKATEAAARHAAYNKTFASHLNILKKCQAGNDHNFIADPHYGNKKFCTTCETEKN